MLRIALSVAGVAVMFAALAVDATACDERYPWLCQPAASEPTATEEPLVLQPRTAAGDTNRANALLKRSRSTERSSSPHDRSKRALSEVKHQFEEFLAERERGAAPASGRPEDREALFREFMQWRKDRASSR